MFRRLVSRSVLTFLLLVLAFSIASYGYGPHYDEGGYPHGLFGAPPLWAGTLALGLILPVGLLARRVPAGVPGYVLGGVVGALGFGVGALVGVFLSELHHPPSEAWGYTVDALVGGVESLRGWLLAVTAGGAVGVASRARAAERSTLGRWWVGTLGLAGTLAIVVPVTQGWLAPLAVLLLALVLISLPLCQVTVLVLVFADAMAMGPPPTREVEPDLSPRPAVSAIAARELADLDGVTFALTGGAAAALCGIDAHEEALALLDACPPQKGRAHGMWTVTRSAALIGLGRLDEAIASLEALGRCSHTQVEAVRLNNQVVAALAVEDPLDGRWVEAARTASESWPGDLPGGTLGAALIRSGEDPASGVAMLGPLVDDDRERSELAPSGWAFRYWAYAHGLRALDRPEEAAAWLQRAVEAGGLWGRKAAEQLGDAAEEVDSAPQGPPGSEEVAGVEPEGGDEPPREDPQP